jgi:hypothetical protein
MLSFAADFWPMLWTILGVGAAFTVLVTMAIAGGWPQEERTTDATLIQLAAAYQATEREHAKAA